MLISILMQDEGNSHITMQSNCLSRVALYGHCKQSSGGISQALQIFAENAGVCVVVKVLVRAVTETLFRSTLLPISEILLGSMPIKANQRNSTRQTGYLV